MRAAIYARISSADDTENVEDQQRRCAALVEREGWQLVASFTDNDLSGAKDESSRLAFARLAKLVRSGKVDVVVAREQSRLARDTDLLLDFQRICKDAGVKEWRFLSGAPFVFGQSRVQSLVQAAMDEEYRQKVIENTKNAKQRKAEAGERLGGRRVYGYTKGAVPTIIEDEAKNIRYAAQSVLDGRTLSSIVREWNDEGLTTSTGTKWRQTTLSQLLKNRVYIARTTLRGEDCAAGQWEAILDEDTFRDVGVFLSNPERAPQKIGREYPLVGVLYCYCGKRMGSTPTRKGDQRIRRYGCRLHGNNINADIPEGWIKRNLLPLADMPRVGQIIRDAEGHLDEEAAALRVLIAQAKAKKAELAQGVSEGVFSLDDIRKPSAQLQAEIVANEAQLATLAGRSALDKFSGRVLKDWDTFDVEDRRSIILSLVSKITVRSTEVLRGERRLLPHWKVAALAAIDPQIKVEVDEMKKEYKRLQEKTAGRTVVVEEDGTVVVEEDGTVVVEEAL